MIRVCAFVIAVAVLANIHPAFAGHHTKVSSAQCEGKYSEKSETSWTCVRFFSEYSIDGEGIAKRYLIKFTVVNEFEDQTILVDWPALRQAFVGGQNHYPFQPLLILAPGNKKEFLLETEEAPVLVSGYVLVYQRSTQDYLDTIKLRHGLELESAGVYISNPSAVFWFIPPSMK